MQHWSRNNENKPTKSIDMTWYVSICVFVLFSLGARACFPTIPFLFRFNAIGSTLTRTNGRTGPRNHYKVKKSWLRAQFAQNVTAPVHVVSRWVWFCIFIRYLLHRILTQWTQIVHIFKYKNIWPIEINHSHFISNDRQNMFPPHFWTQFGIDEKLICFLFSTVYKSIKVNQFNSF